MTTATMDTPSTRAPGPLRGIGALAIALGAISLALLAFHPGGAAHDFAGVLKEEAANRAADALVHGSFIAVLALQMVCYCVLSARLGLHRISVVAALVFFAMGVAFMSASMVVDGLLTPAVAARYVAKPDKIETARGLFVLMGLAISFLMPIGLAFQAAAVADWGWALNASGTRGAGRFALGLGLVMLAAAMAGMVTMNPIGLMIGMAGTAAWAVTAGVLLLRTQP